MQILRIFNGLKWLSTFNNTFEMFSKIVQPTFLFFADFFQQLSLLTFLLHIAILTILTSIGINARERERGGKKTQCFCRIFPIYFNALYACQTLPYLMHFNATWADTTHITRGFIFIQLQSNNSFNFCRIMQILQSCVCVCVCSGCAIISIII